MTKQVEEVCSIYVVSLVVKNTGCWWLIPESPSHSFFSFFSRNSNPIDLSTQKSSESVSTKGQTFLYKNFNYHK